MSHTPHGDVHEFGLADGCEDCADAAAAPFARLDDRMLVELVDRTLSDRFGYVPEGVPPGVRYSARSENEAVAMAAVVNALERLGRLAEATPEALEWYLRERWKISCALGGRVPDAPREGGAA